MDKELSTLKKAQKLGAEKAQSLSKALGLSIAVVKDDEVVSISSDGKETKIGKVAFGRVKVTKKSYVIK
jgi:hypothetical protein